MEGAKLDRQATQGFTGPEIDAGRLNFLEKKYKRQRGRERGRTINGYECNSKHYKRIVITLEWPKMKGM